MIYLLVVEAEAVFLSVTGGRRDTLPQTVTARMRRVTRRLSRRTALTAPAPARPRLPSCLWPRPLSLHAQNTPREHQRPGENSLCAHVSFRHRRLIWSVDRRLSGETRRRARRSRAAVKLESLSPRISLWTTAWRTLTDWSTITRGRWCSAWLRLHPISPRSDLTRVQYIFLKEHWVHAFHFQRRETTAEYSRSQRFWVNFTQYLK